MARIIANEFILSLKIFARSLMLYESTTSCLPMRIAVGSSLVALSGGKSEHNTHGIMRRSSRKPLSGWSKQVGVQFIIRRVGKMTDDILDYWLGDATSKQARINLAI